MKARWSLPLFFLMPAACGSSPPIGDNSYVPVSDGPSQDSDRKPTQQTPTPTPTSGRPDSGVVDAATKGDPPPGDAGSGGAGACSPGGKVVYAFSNGDRWSYSTTDAPPSGFGKRGPVFRLADPDQGGTTTVYLLHSSQADDYLVSANRTEGSGLGYVVSATLGPAYSAQPSGSVRLHRFVKPSPLRHYASVSSSGAPSGFDMESDQTTATGFVCPP